MATISNQFPQLGLRTDLAIQPKSVSSSGGNRHGDKSSAETDRGLLAREAESLLENRKATGSEPPTSEASSPHGPRVDLPVSPKSASPSVSSPNSDKPNEGDQVQWTSEAESFLKAAGLEPQKNDAKIQALKQAIESGEYQVNSERLAKNILKFEQNLA